MMRIIKKEIETVRRFEFSAPYRLKNDDVGRVRTEVTINYAKKTYSFLDSGRYYLESSTGGAVIAKFETGSDLDKLFKELFEAAEVFAEKELRRTYLFISKKGVVSFNDISFDTPVKIANNMRKEVIDFFEKNPKGALEFQFGGFARLSPKFAKELFKGNNLKEYYNKITTRQIHVFDQLIIEEAIK